MKQASSNFSPGGLAASMTALVAPWLPAVRGPVATQTRVIRLDPGEVLRLEKTDGIHHLEVRQGIAWLTETPASEDKLLATGERFGPTGNWPIVIQALGRSRLVLTIG